MEKAHGRQEQPHIERGRSLAAKRRIHRNNKHPKVKSCTPKAELDGSMGTTNLKLKTVQDDDVDVNDKSA